MELFSIRIQRTFQLVSTRQPVLPALSLVETACRNRRRDTNFSGYGGTFRKIHRTFVHRTNNNRITVKRTWLKLKSKIQK